MPITRPKEFLDAYRDGEDHFKHVLECLQLPAVEEAGFDPFFPRAEGAALIQAEIISKLETIEQ
jgi:hypothetical protein